LRTKLNRAKMFFPSVPARDEVKPEADRAQTSIKSFGQLHNRDVKGLLPLACRTDKPAVKRAAPTNADNCAATVPKKRKASAARGIGIWLRISFVIGELKGDEGRTARVRAMLQDVVDGAFHVKVLFGYEQKGVEWFEKKLAGEENPSQGPLARRGEDGKTKYIKLSAGEKHAATQVYDSLIAAGWTSRAAINHMHENFDRFCNGSSSSISSWRNAQSAGSNNSEQIAQDDNRKAGAPPVVPQEIKDEIKKKVRVAYDL
jgi:hypothetical protein